MKNKLIVIFIILLSTNLFAQKSSISGFVEDKDTGEKLVNATVRISNSKYATFTNEYGYFNLITDNLDTVTIICSYIGYEKEINKIKLENELFINFKLKYNNSIDSIVISRDIPIEKRNEMGIISLPISQIKAVPMLMGEADLMKTFQTMPGVESGSEGKSDLYVRGGNPDENLVLLDDVPLYYLNHFGGFISVFNIDAINSVKMYKGAFPARYGSRLSSVIDIRMKEGNMKKLQGNYTIGVLSTKFEIEGPIKRDKASFIISARVFPWYRMISPLTKLSYGQTFGYDFYDLNGKINYKINQKNQIFLSLYTGNDDVFFSSEELKHISNYENISSTKWGNSLLAFRWNTIILKKIFANTTISATKFNYDISSTNGSQGDSTFFSYSFNSLIKDYSAKSTFDYRINKHYKIKFGYNLTNHLFAPGITNYGNNNKIITFGYKETSALENYIFIENHIKISNLFYANFGFHYSSFYYNKKHFSSYQPRIIATFNPFDKISIKGSYNEMQQFTHLITSSSLASSVNLWVPAEDTLPPSKSKQWSIGIYKSFSQNNLEISIETYYKTTDNLITFKEGAILGGIAENWKNKIETNGIGISKGMEVLLQKKQGKLTGWISYTLAKSDKKFSNINNGQIYPSKYDRRHNFNIVCSYKFKENINFSLSWKYGSGYPYSMPIARYNTINETYRDSNYAIQMYDEQAYIYSNKNTYRMRAYHRLDFGINFSKEKKHGTRTWIISIYNVYNRQNPYFYFYSQKGTNLNLYQVSFFPIIPSISYSFKFK